MFNCILSHYHLQEKDWLYSDPSPVQVGHHFELNVKLTQAATQCPSCQGTKFYRHGTTPHPRKVQLTEYMGLPCFLMITIERYRCVTCGMTQSSQIPEQLVLKGHKDSTLLKTQIIRRLTEKESIKDASHDLNVSSHSFYQLIIKCFLFFINNFIVRN